MKTIGIIGATGQVGTEVCLFLSTYQNVRPVAIARSSVSAAVLRRLGIECRVGALGDEAQCRELLHDCDLVVDFSAPVGDVKSINRHYESHISKALQYSPAHAKYVFISSINAFGMSEQFNRAKHYLLPHSIYAATKRFGEQKAINLGRKLGKESYVFRLGHVHGLLQRVSWETAHLVAGNYRRFEYPATPSYTIFCFSIAEALVNILEGKEKPGKYVLISEPAWSWKEVLEYYAGGKSLNVILTQPEKTNPVRSLLSGLKKGISSLLIKYKDTLRANVLPYFPDLEKKQKASHYTRRAQQQIAEMQQQFTFQPEGIHEGIFPEKRLKSLSDSRFSMAIKTEEVKTMLKNLPQPPLPTTII
ncbi:MAG: NAD-dependent epimerase/dehydratase family protein, partial [Bacteroidota bacterium]